MTRVVDVTFLGEGAQGPLFQALAQPLCGSFGPTFEQTCEMFVQSWNDYTGENAAAEDFEFVQHGGLAANDEE